MTDMKARILLTKLHNAYTHFTYKDRLPLERRGVTDVDEVSTLIAQRLTSDEPCMIARYGSGELDAVCNHLGVEMGGGGLSAAWQYVLNKRPQWWWNENVVRRLCINAGFFPGTPEALARFGKLMTDDSRQVDILGSWLTNEDYMKPYFQPDIRFFDREKINPFFAKNPWTLALKGKKVLVVHPFVESIKQQYARKDLLFPRPVLPDFEMKIVPAVQSIGGNAQFADWFAALKHMEDQIDSTDYEVALLGCGAYGFPLAAHIKRQGKKAVHIGGSLQLFFGIKGKRWETLGYIGGPNDYSTLFNEYWIRPLESERPKAAQKVEDGCYW